MKMNHKYIGTELRMFRVFLFYLCCLIAGILGSSSIDCNFNNNYDFYAVGYKYSCKVSSNLNISSPESARIDAVNGVHMSGKSNNDEIYFHAREVHIEYFPIGLEKFFTNLTAIAIWYNQLKEIHQEDLKPYTKLKCLSIGMNDIEVIEDGLFDFQPDIEVITLYDLKLFHISSTVFDNLSKLTSLRLLDNNCTNMISTNNRTGVLEIIKSVKSTCISSDYLNFTQKIEKMQKEAENLTLENLNDFQEKVEQLQIEVKSLNSKFVDRKAKALLELGPRFFNLIASEIRKDYVKHKEYLLELIKESKANKTVKSTGSMSKSELMIQKVKPMKPLVIMMMCTMSLIQTVALVVANKLSHAI